LGFREEKKQCKEKFRRLEKKASINSKEGQRGPSKNSLITPNSISQG